MSDLEATITAEMRRQGCRRLPVGSPIYDYDTCREHLDVWIDGACEVVAESVRAGWDAAINAAADGETGETAMSSDLTLASSIRQLLNDASRKNASGTPDYILARYLLDILNAFEKAARYWDEWWGHEPKRGERLPIHRTEAGYPNCATCDGGGCPDCTDPA